MRSKSLNKKKSIAIIQARMKSTRLRGKILLPIERVPIILLAVERISNTGRTVIVAISDDSSDDILAKLLIKKKILLFRGSTDDVLSRFAYIVKNFNKETLIFRLTADNIFPDGMLLDEMEKFFLKKRINYLTTGSEESGLPYGVGVELTKAKFILEANLKSKSSFEREHVTPYIKKKFKVHIFEKYKNLNMSSYRCTIDTLNDYKIVKKTFRNLGKKAGKILFKKLLPKLKKIQETFLDKKNNKKIVLGCAQLGANYGINNTTGKPSQKKINQILNLAIKNNIKFFDTARDYKNSEKIIGNFFQINKSKKKEVQVITKLSSLKLISKKFNKKNIIKKVDESVFNSLKTLKQKKIDTLLVHKVSDLKIQNGLVLNRLKQLKKRKLIKNIGVSLQTPNELSQVISDKDINHIQLPMNILDWRWKIHEKKILKRKKRGSFIVHARSTLLQGLILSKKLSHWRRANINPVILKKITTWFKNSTLYCRNYSKTGLPLSFVNSINWIDGIVVGVEAPEQLEENINNFNSPKLSKKEIEMIIKSRPLLTNKTLNPFLWNK